MRKKRKSYIAVTGSIKPEWLRGTEQKNLYRCLGIFGGGCAIDRR